jgi:signal transduction histidine kinase
MPRTGSTLLVSLGCATLIGVVATAQHYLMMRLMAAPKAWGHALGETLPFWLFWGLAAPVVAWLVRRYPLTARTWPASVLLHLGAVATLALAFATVRQAFEWWILDPVPHQSFPAIAFGWLASNLTAYAGIVALVLGLESARRARTRERQAEALSAELTEARLAALRSQVEPHFLFNALNSIAMLVRQGEGDRAVRMIADLGGLLRHATSDAAPQLVPLSQELELVRQYLAIEATRFGNRLRVLTEVPAELAGAEVPSLVLQPLVENAIRHGISATTRPGTVEIRAHQEGDSLVLQVIDDGPGPASGPVREGIGLRNGRARL